MKKLRVFLMLMVLGACAFGQAERRVDSKISAVTVFLNRAQVTREVKTKIESGKSAIILSGLTAQLDPQSIQVSGKGNFVILGISHQQNYLNELNMPKVLRVLKDSIEYFEKALILEQNLREVLNKEEQMLLSNQKIGGGDQNLTAAELKAMADFYRVRLNEIVTGRIRHDERIKKMNERLGKIQHQLQEQNDLHTRNTSEIVINVSCDVATQGELSVSYVVGNAGWHPVYDIRAIDTKRPVQLQYKANVFQHTGEEWNNVSLALSTANPTLGGVKPDLNTWYLDIRNPVARTARYRKDADYAMKEAAAPAQMKAEESNELEGVVTLEAFTTTVQTSLNTEFKIALPYTVLSAAKPTLVDIGSHELQSDYAYSSAPKLGTDAFLMAKITGWEAFSLLPGEANVFFEGTFVTKTYIDPQAIGDTLAVSLGRDKRVVVKREQLKDYSTRKMIGSHQRDSYTYEISVRNTKREPIKISVEDQVPVSQNSQIEVTLTQADKASHNKDTGKLTWAVTIQPNETKKITYQYEVRYPKGAMVAGLNQ